MRVDTRNARHLFRQAMQIPSTLFRQISMISLVVLCLLCGVAVGAAVVEYRTPPPAGRGRTLAGSSGNNEALLLLTFKAAVTGDPSGALLNWTTAADDNTNGSTSSPCRWRGVTCDAQGSVAALDLSGQKLSGSISGSALSGLPHLASLNLSANNLTGPIPLTTFPSLTSLDLSDNRLTGPLPATLCYNGLNLTLLNLKNNSLSGTIPPTLGNCTSLITLSLYSNSLSGPIPPELGSLSQLQTLTLSFNQLNGTIPTTILTNCTKLITLALSRNKFSGRLPRDIGELKSLQSLWLDGNGFSGSIPHEIGNLTQLTLLQLDTNNLTGTIPPSLGQLASLTRLLSLSINQLSGPIPPQLGNLSNLTILTLRGNSLNGTIPAEFGNMRSLQGLFLGDNMLEGTIPVELANCTSLQQMRLFGNRLSGSIPDALGSLQYLTELYAHDNMLQGPIPASLAHLSRLQDLSLGFNALNGPIPPSIASLPTIVFNFSMPHNSLTGTIPSGLGQMIHVENIDLSSNNLSGTIPANIGDCVNLMQLNLSYNSLTGEIPESFVSLGLLQVLDLSGNSLSGTIPSILADLTELQYINLSSNNFTGQIPTSGVFAKMNASSFLSNPGLCGAPLTQACPIATPAPQSSSQTGGLQLGFKILVIILSFLFGLVLLLLLKSFLKRKKAVATSPTASTLEYSKHLKQFTAQELETATENFNEERIIGTGGVSKVYRATSVTLRLAPTIKQVDAAVKVLSNDHKPSFCVELETLGSIRHRNLVKFHGFCDDGNLQAFVLELLPKGSLQDCLHASDAYYLSFSLRLHIALDVAHGLAYLHHSLKNQIVHRDVKPSNILLDNDMVAKVADFGIAKLLGPDEVHSKAKGTPGYVAPEYGESTRVDAKGDVYSFGIVMLEMLTRKEPTDTMFGNMGLSLPNWVRSAYPDRCSEILDPELLGDEYDVSEEDEAIMAMLGLALACTEMKPENRPDMETVVNKLTLIGSSLSSVVTAETKCSIGDEEVALSKE